MKVSEIQESIEKFLVERESAIQYHGGKRANYENRLHYNWMGKTLCWTKAYKPKGTKEISHVNCTRCLRRIREIGIVQ